MQLGKKKRCNNERGIFVEKQTLETNMQMIFFCLVGRTVPVFFNQQRQWNALEGACLFLFPDQHTHTHTHTHTGRRGNSWSIRRSTTTTTTTRAPAGLDAARGTTPINDGRPNGAERRPPAVFSSRRAPHTAPRPNRIPSPTARNPLGRQTPEPPVPTAKASSVALRLRPALDEMTFLMTPNENVQDRLIAMECQDS